MKQKPLGIFLPGGGNRAFFELGFLHELKKHNIVADLLIGVSSSSAVMLEEIFNMPGVSLDFFGKRLRANKKNFYFFKKPHTPHNEIYRGSIKELLDRYKYIPKNKMSWKIIATETSKSNVKTKSILASFLLLLKPRAMKKMGLTLLKAEEKIFSSEDNLRTKDLLNIIMGSSMIYPFIKPHFHKGKLLMEGGLSYWDFSNLFAGCEKALIVNPQKGKTKKIKNKLHIFSKKKIPLNILDYTSKEKIQKLYVLGKNEARSQLAIIKKYLKEN